MVIFYHLPYPQQQRALADCPSAAASPASPQQIRSTDSDKVMLLTADTSDIQIHTETVTIQVFRSSNSNLTLALISAATCSGRLPQRGRMSCFSPTEMQCIFMSEPHVLQLTVYVSNLWLRKYITLLAVTLALS